MRPTRVQPGDVYITRVPDGRYGAVRVLRVVGKSALVATSEYLGHDRPSLDDPRLRAIVAMNRGSWNGRPAMMWLRGTPPASVELLGRIPPTGAEAHLECNLSGGKWSQADGYDAYLEWRWMHDRKTSEAEMQQRQEARERGQRLSQKPGKMMNEEDFWSIIRLLDWRHEGDDEKVLQPAVAALATRPRSDIRAFEERLAFLLYQLDTRAHASNIGGDAYDPETGSVSADAFLYARCVAVANGPELYESALRDPMRMPKDLEFESLLELASAAYELKTGEELDNATGCSYESCSNPLGWDRTLDGGSTLVPSPGSP